VNSSSGAAAEAPAAAARRKRRTRCMKRVVAGAGDGGAISAGEGRAALLPRRGWQSTNRSNQAARSHATGRQPPEPVHEAPPTPWQQRRPSLAGADGAAVSTSSDNPLHAPRPPLPSCRRRVGFSGAARGGVHGGAAPAAAPRPQGTVPLLLPLLRAPSCLCRAAPPPLPQGHLPAGQKISY